MAWPGEAGQGLAVCAGLGSAWHGLARQGPARRGRAWPGEAGQGLAVCAGHGEAWLGLAGQGEARQG